jgi:hypothetical protein
MQVARITFMKTKRYDRDTRNNTKRRAFERIELDGELGAAFLNGATGGSDGLDVGDFTYRYDPEIDSPLFI